MKYLLYFASFLSLLLVGITAYFVHEVIAFTPNTEEEVGEWRKLNRFDALDWPIREISFNTYENSIEKTGQALTLRGVLITAKDPSQAPTVIALHGKGSNRIGVLRFGHLFHQAGFNVLIYDQRQHGRSDGTYTTYGYYESHDVRAAIEFLENEGINITELGIIGESFGAATAILAGALDERIDFVIADSSYIDMTTAVTDNAWRMNSLPSFPIPQLGFNVAAWLAEFDPWSVSPINALKVIEKPVLIIHCDQDVWAYPDYAYQLYENSDKHLTELKMFRDCEHVEAYDKYTETYEELVYGFLQRHLPDIRLQSVLKQ